MSDHRAWPSSYPELFDELRRQIDEVALQTARVPKRIRICKLVSPGYMMLVPVDKLLVAYPDRPPRPDMEGNELLVNPDTWDAVLRELDAPSEVTGYAWGIPVVRDDDC